MISDSPRLPFQYTFDDQEGVAAFSSAYLPFLKRHRDRDFPNCAPGPHFLINRALLVDVITLSQASTLFTMPATRKSSRGAAAKGPGKQSTLSFNNKVTKTGAAKATAKETAAAAAALTPPPSSLAPEEKKKVIIEPVGEGETEEVLDVFPQEEEAAVKAAEEKPQAEVRAEKISQAQIQKYWKGVEEARIAKRVHQGDLSLAEKVLRYFDISSQYGVSRSPSSHVHAPSDGVMW